MVAGLRATAQPCDSRVTIMPSSAGWRLDQTGFPRSAYRWAGRNILQPLSFLEGNAMAEKLPSYSAFWPYYLREHGRARTRALHFLGTSLALICLVLLIVTGNWWWLPAALVAGYLFAWIGHFFIEHNRPATFIHPLWSLASDFRMYGLWVTGRLKGELRRAGVEP
jgi:hypothetical protein